ncbi:MAG: hypothetical protein QGG48_11210, partial [Desulfatiglandales bacterium]|nr:hypothetical protein [Desulfatiglandales bacterium]
VRQFSPFLFMTAKPAVHLGVSFPVTFDAETHFKHICHKPVHFFYVTMTFRAVNVFSNMAFVAEPDVVRNIHDPLPRDRVPCIKVFLQLPYLRMLRDNVLMTKKTFPHSRNTRFFRTLHKSMAEAAIDPLDAGMHPVAEIDRLLRPDNFMGIEIIQIQHDCNQAC